MSTYGNALQRWEDDAAPRLANAGLASTPFANLMDRLEPAAPIATAATAFAGVSGRERAADVAAGYARALAERGLRVLYVDLAPHAEEPGDTPLEALVAAETPLAEPQTAQVVTVASSPRFEGRPRAFEASLKRWLDAQRPRFDRLVLHSGPVLGDAVALQMTTWADSVVLVVRARWTARGDLVAARDRLRAAGAPLAGTVLSGAPPLPGWLYRLLRPLGRAA